MNRRLWTQPTKRSLLALVTVTCVIAGGEGPAHVWSAAAGFPVTILWMRAWREVRSPPSGASSAPMSPTMRT
jgi:hypothetical protein